MKRKLLLPGQAALSRLPLSSTARGRRTVVDCKEVTMNTQMNGVVFPALALLFSHGAVSADALIESGVNLQSLSVTNTRKVATP